MPPRIPKPCRSTKCSQVTTDRSGYCEAHADQRHGWTKTQQGKTTTQRGYGHAWGKLRKLVMERDSWLCQVCMSNNRVTQATEVDHIKPKSQGGSDHQGNLRAICKACHKAKTQTESGGGGVNLYRLTAK